MEENKAKENTMQKDIILDKGIIKVKLSKKVKFNDVEVEKIELDFNSLTGADICEAEGNFRDKFHVPVPEANYSKGFQAAVAAKASNLPYDLILELNYVDFTKVTGAAKGFLMA